MQVDSDGDGVLGVNGLGANGFGGNGLGVQETGADTSDPAAAIEEAVAGLDELDELPVGEHVARFDAVHVALNVALSTIDAPH